MPQTVQKQPLNIYDIAPQWRWVLNGCEFLVIAGPHGRPMNIAKKARVIMVAGAGKGGQGTEVGRVMNQGQSSSGPTYYMDGLTKAYTEVTIAAVFRITTAAGFNTLAGNQYGTDIGYAMYAQDNFLKLGQVPNFSTFIINQAITWNTAHWYAAIVRTSPNVVPRVFIRDLNTAKIVTGTGTHIALTGATSGGGSIGYWGPTEDDGMNGFIQMGAMWRRAWTDGQMMEWILDPYAMVRRRRDPWPVYKKSGASANVSVTGVASTSAVGTPTLAAAGNVTIGGVASTSAVGSVVGSAGATVIPSGVICNSAIGTVAASTGDANVTIGGVAVASAVGAVAPDPYADYVLFDSVTRSNSTTLAGAPTEKGPTPTADTGVWGVNSNHIYSVSNVTSQILRWDLGVPAGFFQLDFSTDAIQTHGSQDCLRIIDNSNLIRAKLYANAGKVSIVVTVAGTTHQTDSAVILATTGSVSGTIKLTVDQLGFITLYVNGTSRATYQMTSTEITALLSDTHVGLQSAGSGGTATSAWVDNLQAGPIITLVTPSGVAGTSAIGTLSLSASANVALAGVSVTSAIGAPTEVTAKPVTGVAVAAAIGTPVVVGNASITLTGVAVAAAIGAPVGNVIVAPNGVGVAAVIGAVSVTAQLDANVTLGGVSAASAIGTVTITDSVNDAINGVQATAAVALVSIAANAVVALSGVSASSAVGAPIVGEAAVVTGVQATSALGTVAVHGNATVALSGVSASTALGTIAITTNGNATVSVSGVAVGSAAGVVLVVGTAHVSPAGVAVASAIGTPVVADLENASIAGVFAIGSVGLPAVHVDVNVAVSGVAASAAIGHPIVTANASLQPSGVIAYGAIGVTIEVAGLGPEYVQSGRRLAIYRGVK